MNATNNGNGSVSLEHLNELFQCTAVLLPIREREKRPRLLKWQTVDLARSQKPGYQKMLELPAYPNTGVLLGEPSGGLCATDFDNEEAAEAVLALNPELRRTLRSKGKRGCQIWLYPDGGYPHKIHKLTDKAGQSVGEWRADGGQSVIRGIHPEGMHYQLLVDSKPLRIKFNDIQWPAGWLLPWLEKEEPGPGPDQQDQAGHPRAGVPPGVQLDEKLENRVREYLRTVEPAISGRGGHATTFRVACVLVWGFGLDPQDAFQYFQEYNRKCQPPWSEGELWHKLEDALNAKDHTKERGYLLNEEEKQSAKAKPEDTDKGTNPPESDSQDNAKNENPEPPPGDNQDPPKDDWLEALKLAACTSEELRNLKIPARKPLVDDFFKCGDLGFIFGERGYGKSWLGLVLARGIATGTKCGPWQVHQEMKVLYVDGEMPIDDVRARDTALGKPCRNLTLLSHEILFSRTDKTLNLAEESLQQALTKFCVELKFDVLILDNLSTLTSGMDENKGSDWEAVQSWLLDLRRRGISVVFIHHAGRNNLMRGHSKREDPAFWIIRLDRINSSDDDEGAHFTSTFTKNRNAPTRPKDYDWHIVPDGKGSTNVTFKNAGPKYRFRQLVEAGVTDPKDIAVELGVTKGRVSQLAALGVKEGWLRKEKGKYIYSPRVYKTAKERKEKSDSP